MLCRVVRVLVRLIWFLGTRRKALVLESGFAEQACRGCASTGSSERGASRLGLLPVATLANEKITQQYCPDERLRITLIQN
jgi:hypothetical protein